VGHTMRLSYIRRKYVYRSWGWGWWVGVVVAYRESGLEFTDIFSYCPLQ